MGYTVVPPEGWEDVTREVAATSTAEFDVAYGGPELDGVRVNLNIARRDAGRAPVLEALVRDGRREVGEIGGREIRFTPPVPATVGGERALRYDFTTNGRRVRQVGTVHGRDYYVVTLTAADSAFGRAVPALDALLRSWRWD